MSAMNNQECVSYLRLCQEETHIPGSTAAPSGLTRLLIAQIPAMMEEASTAAAATTSTTVGIREDTAADTVVVGTAVVDMDTVRLPPLNHLPFVLTISRWRCTPTLGPEKWWRRW